MLATSRMWRFTRWMREVWWQLLRVGALAGKRRPGRLKPLQTALPPERLHCIPAFCLRPIRRWPCLTHSGLAEAEEAVGAVVERAAAVAVVGAEVEAAAVAGGGGTGGGGPGGGGRGGTAVGGRGGGGNGGPRSPRGG